MKLLTISNLYPRPDQPQRGLFNLQMFAALAGKVDQVQNVCLVPEWRIWRWATIRSWSDAGCEGLSTRYVPTFYVPIVGRNLSWLTYFLALRTVADMISDCDAILVTWLYPDSVAVMKMAARYNKPVWIKVHGSDTFHMVSPSRHGRILDACKRAQGIISNSEVLQVRLVDAGVAKQKIRVVPNGVNTKRFCFRSKDGAVEELQSRGAWPGTLDPEDRIVLFAGNLLPVKRPEILIHVLKELESESKAPTFLIIGDGPLRATLEQQVKESGVDGSVCFLGSRSHDEVALWMNVAECLCLISRSEGMPNVVLESLVSGLPVVSTDVGDVRSFVNEGDNGCIVSTDSDDLVNEFGKALSQVLSKTWNREEIAGKAGVCSWETAAERIVDEMGLGEWPQKGTKNRKKGGKNRHSASLGPSREPRQAGG